MEKQALIHAIKHAKVDYKTALAAEVSQAIDVLDEVEGGQRTKIETALDGLQEALATREAELIRNHITMFRDAMRDIVELNPLPADPDFFTPALIAKIEEQFGESVENIPTGSRIDFCIKIGRTEYRDRGQNLFYRIANNFLKDGAKATAGRQYLVLRKQGIPHDEAVARSKEQTSENIPISEETFMPGVIRSIEQALKVGSMMEVSSKDRTAFSVTIEGKTYSDVTQNLFYRISNKFFDLNSPALAKQYLALRGAGFSHERSKSMALAERQEGTDVQRKSRADSLPVDPSFLTTEVISKIQDALGKPLSKVSVNDDTLFTVTVKGQEYSDKPLNLFERVSSTVFGVKAKARARMYVVLLGNGLTHEEAVAKSETEQGELRKRGNNLPADPELLNSETVLQIEEKLGMSIEDVSVGNRTEFTIKIGEVEYTDAACNLFHRIAAKFFGAPTTQRARTYLELRKYEMEHEEAVTTVLESTEVKPKKERNNNPVPVSPEFFDASFIRQLEDVLGTSVEDVSLNDEKKFNVQIGEYTYQDRVRSFLVRIARSFYKSDNQRLGRDYLIMRKQGKGHEDAISVKIEPARKSIPAEPETLSSDLVVLIEQQLGCSIEEVRVSDNTKFTIAMGDKQFIDRPITLFTRICNTFAFANSKAAARKYLQLRKEGMEHETAVTMARNPDAEVDYEFEEISQLKLEDAIALLQNDPYKLKLYLQFAHPELTEKEIDRLVIRSFKGLLSYGNDRKEDEYLGYEENLPNLEITDAPEPTTEDHFAVVSGYAEGADAIYVAGTWNRRVRINPDGSFTVRVPLKIGEPNDIRIMGINRREERRTQQELMLVLQDSEPDDTEALVDLLSAMRSETLGRIRRDPERFKFLVQCAEQVLIKKFTRSFEDGKRYVEQLLQQNKSPVIQAMLRRVLSNFQAIERKKYPNVRNDSPLYFFQKYCVDAIEKKIAAGEPGVILANDPGLGKTRTAWVAINGHKAVIISPNSVVSAWGEEAAKCLRETDMHVLQYMPYPERKRLLREDPRKHTVTNIEFMRDEKDDERFKLLSDEETIIVHDEAHSRANLASEQTKGIRKLNGMFTLLMSATPAKNPRTFRRMMHTLYPDKPEFSNDQAFLKAFPANDPQALQALSLMKRSNTIRFRKKDVMEEVDPSLPLEIQKDRLPRKEYVDPERVGHFTMSDEQAMAIYEMFISWERWTRKYDRYVPKDDIAKMDNLRRQNALTKKHALRQTINNPSYIGANTTRDAKAAEVKKCIEECIREGRKVVIFCGYNAQASKYAELFSQYNPALFTGITSEEGYRRDEQRKLIRYRVKSDGTWARDARGYPIEDVSGQPMLSLDYERLTFQYAPDRRILISTYPAGAVGTTFTAGKAVIEDDLPADCIEEIQAEDRTHRIDHEHQTHHEVKYFKMISRYSKKFLADMKKRWVQKMEDGTYKEILDARRAKELHLPTAYEEFFAQGTYDEVQARNLIVQRQMFHLINDGITDETILDEERIPFKALELNGEN